MWNLPYKNTRIQYRRQPGFGSGKYFTGMTLKTLLSVKNCPKLKMYLKFLKNLISQEKLLVNFLKQNKIWNISSYQIYRETKLGML